MTETRYSPLHQLHVDAGASFTDFAGWQMPVSYGSDLAEHHAVRTAAGIFDISHMAEIRVTGPDAAAFLDYALAGKLSAVAVPKAKYSLLLDADGGIIDDLVVYHVTQGEHLVVANAGNHDPVLEELIARALGFDVSVDDESDSTALIAVQGPHALAVLQATPGLTGDFADIGYYTCTPGAFGETPILVGRTGYTGEDGFELYIRVEDAAALWSALLTAGAAHGLIPAGLASRDTLRLEAGMPLYGHELGLDTMPVQAGLGRVVALTKEGEFVGRAAIEDGPAAGARVLVGLRLEGRRAGRADYEVFVAAPDGVAPESAAVGVVTSGVLSPTLGYPVAMAYVDPGVIEAALPLAVDVRGTRVPASIVPLPFYKRESK